MKEASRPSPSPTEDTKALCGAITPGAEGLPSSVPDAHLPNARLPPCGGPSPPFACSRVLMPRAAAPYPDPRSDGRGSFPPLARLRRSLKVCASALFAPEENADLEGSGRGRVAAHSRLGAGLATAH